MKLPNWMALFVGCINCDSTCLILTPFKLLMVRITLLFVFLLFLSYVVISQVLSHTLTLIFQQKFVEITQSFCTQMWENLAQSQPDPPSQGLQNARFLVFLSISIICRSPREKSGLCCELSCQLLCIHTERYLYPRQISRH